MRYSPQHKAETRTRLLQQAASELKTTGLAGASIDQIAAAAGLTGGAVSNHFPSKRDLFAAVIQQEIEGSFLTRLARKEGLTKQQLLAGVQQYVSVRHLEDVEGGCPIPPLGADISRADKALREQVGEWLEELHDAWADAIGCPSQAWVLLSQCVGAVLIARMFVGEARNDLLSSLAKGLEQPVAEA